MHFKWVNHMVCKLHFNKAVIKNNVRKVKTQTTNWVKYLQHISQIKSEFPTILITLKI